MATKTIHFDDEKEKKLLDFLQSLKHGAFSSGTKEYWTREMIRQEIDKEKPKIPRDMVEMFESNPDILESDFFKELKGYIDKSVTESIRKRRTKKKGEEIT